MRRTGATIAAVLLPSLPLLPSSPPAVEEAAARPRARDAGVIIGAYPTGRWNAITDVGGVRVGHRTVRRGETIRTGVTAILPHDGNLYRDRIAAAVHVGNGFGKLIGSTQVDELGEIETPILLTCTLCVWKAADAMVDWLLGLPGMEGVRSINPVVAETNDGFLNDIRRRPVGHRDVIAALESAASGPVPEGSIGAGTGTVAFGWKGGIGTSSRLLPADAGGHTVGVLVQTNFGGDLFIAGVPVGRELDRTGETAARKEEGSIIVVVATDAPADSRQLDRLAFRALAGVARTGAAFSNGSGDYVIAFSTGSGPGEPPLGNDSITPLFRAVADATEEAIYNSLFRATPVRGHRGAVEALPLAETLEILRRHGALSSESPAGREDRAGSG